MFLRPGYQETKLVPHCQRGGLLQCKAGNLCTLACLIAGVDSFHAEGVASMQVQPATSACLVLHWIENDVGQRQVPQLHLLCLRP